MSLVWWLLWRDLCFSSTLAGPQLWRWVKTRQNARTLSLCLLTTWDGMRCPGTILSLGMTCFLCLCLDVFAAFALCIGLFCWCVCVRHDVFVFLHDVFVFMLANILCIWGAPAQYFAKVLWNLFIADLMNAMSFIWCDLYRLIIKDPKCYWHKILISISQQT